MAQSSVAPMKHEKQILDISTHPPIHPSAHRCTVQSSDAILIAAATTLSAAMMTGDDCGYADKGYDACDVCDLEHCYLGIRSN